MKRRKKVKSEAGGGRINPDLRGFPTFNKYEGDWLPWMCLEVSGSMLVQLKRMLRLMERRFVRTGALPASQINRET